MNGHLKRIGIKTSAQCPVEKRTEHQNITCNPVHSITKQAANMPTCVSLKTKFWGLQRIGLDIQVCSTHGREDLVNATITSNVEGIE